MRLHPSNEKGCDCHRRDHSPAAGWHDCANQIHRGTDQGRQGQYKGALEFILDVTEESRQRHDANTKIENLNAIPTPIMSIDTDFTVTFINPAGAEAVGLTPDNVIGQKCY